MTNWQGHVCIVTGAGIGIGRGIAEVFLEAGCEVVIAEVNHLRGEETAREFKAKYGRGLFVETDVSRDADCKRMVAETIKAYGKVDTLVNNAGVNFVKPTLEMNSPPLAVYAEGTSDSGKMAAYGHSGTHAPQSMQVAGSM